MKSSEEGRRRRVFVVGAANSAGRAIAEKFASAGALVAACDIDQQGLAALADSHPGITTHRMDACDSAHVAAILRPLLQATAGIDVLVNTVGLPGPLAPLEEVNDLQWESTLRGSAGSAFYCAREVIPWMKRERSGCIITFSSCSTKTGLPGRTPYVVAKYALEGLTRNLARELGPFNIRVNAIVPGAIDNERFTRTLEQVARQRGTSTEQAEAAALRYVSMRSKIHVDEIAAAVMFLASADAPHVTGQLLSVDGNVEWEE